MTRVTITDDVHAELVRLKTQSGMGMMKLLARSGPAPDGLDSAIINSWLHRKTRSAKAEHLEFVLAALRAVDPVIAITPAMRAALEREFARTGYEPASLLNRLRPLPKGLTPALVSRWRTGRTVSARKSLWAFVFEGIHGAPSSQ